MIHTIRSLSWHNGQLYGWPIGQPYICIYGDKLWCFPGGPTCFPGGPGPPGPPHSSAAGYKLVVTRVLVPEAVSLLEFASSNSIAEILRCAKPPLSRRFCVSNNFCKRPPCESAILIACRGGRRCTATFLSYFSCRVE